MWDYARIVINRANSKSYIAVLAPRTRRSSRTTSTPFCSAILQRKDGIVWIDQEKGIFEYPYQTFLVISRKK